MSEINTGGPAFPVPGLQHNEDFNGMTLRDYFAAKVMQGYLTQSDSMDFTYEYLSKAAYEMADAMLKAREH